MPRDPRGRNVIVEDFTDSGLTLSWLTANIRSRSVASVEVFSLLSWIDGHGEDAAKFAANFRHWLNSPVPSIAPILTARR